jgi:hypothetical protein
VAAEGLPAAADATLADTLRDLPGRDRQQGLAEVSAWLGRLVLQYGVPFHYLVPRSGMLSAETIRFFFVDPNWVQALIQGACSVGSISPGDGIVDAVMNQWLQTNRPVGEGAGPSHDDGPTDIAAATVRERLRSEHEGTPPTDGAGRLAWPLTGFLLRSAVVEGWRGLEIEAFDAQGSPLQPLRIEQLTGDVLFALFNGVTRTLVIREPREGLHFGLSADAGNYVKSLRNVDTGEVLEPCIDLGAAGMMRNQDSRLGPPANAAGVIDIAALATQMQQMLDDCGQLVDGHFASAGFGLQMVESPGEFSFACEAWRNTADADLGSGTDA